MNVEILKAGDSILYDGEMIIMRDAAQKRLSAFQDSPVDLPIDLKNKVVFYAGPAKTPSDSAIGAIGPTTSARMDKYLEMLFNFGIKATVGKGERSDSVKDLCRKYKGVYFLAPSGSAAALSQSVINHEILLYEELQSEAIQKIIVNDFPLIVAIDSKGHSIWD
ncbi:MAG: FumA C-terminus/TtdB family hydratase beta subunit [Thermotogota bacterium]|nr:FumA C-terminus/TtdB family hydratase beta subunit [Thermotogota bacterium]